MTVGVDAPALVSYYDLTNGDLKVAHCSNVFCLPYFRRLSRDRHPRRP